MKCSEARELFSAKVDNEIAPARLSRLDTHLANCPECQPHWVQFQSTVSLLRGLPNESTQPAFVGQVLDRIRGYEAEARRVPAPMDRAARFSRWDWMEEARDWMGKWVLRPVPAMALGSLVVGVALGSWVNHVSPSGTSTPAAPSTAGLADDVAAPRPGIRLDPVVSARPFADLADEIRAQNAETPSTGAAQFYSPNWGGGSDWVGQQQVRYENDGARIIF